MKKIIISVLIVLFCASALLFSAYGRDIRAALSPRVILCGVKFGQNGYYLPESAIEYDEESGKSYIYAAVASEKYPEGGYEAKRVECAVYDTADGEVSVFFMFMGVDFNNGIIASSDKKVTAGRMVKIAGYLDYK